MDERKNAIKNKEELHNDLRSNFVAPYPEVDKKIDIKKSQTDDENPIPTFETEYKKGLDKKNFIMSLFQRQIFAELYFAWSKDCGETISIENAKFFRDELLMRDNKALTDFNFRCMRAGKNFLLAFVGNLDSPSITHLDLSDNMITDLCMHNIKSLITAKRVVHLNLASNMISSEGLKVIQTDLMTSETLQYLNFGVNEGSFRRNNFSGEGGLILARILLSNESLRTLILQDNELGEESGEKIGSALIQNKFISKLILADNKIKNKGARAILEHANKLTTLDLSNNSISHEVCIDLKKMISSSNCLQNLSWNSNNVGFKGIKYFVESIVKSRSLCKLALNNTNMGNQGMKILSEALKNNKILNTLDISSNSITYESFVDLCDSLVTNSITNIKSKNNLLGDDSMEYFANTVLVNHSNSNLTSFDFSSCKIYDQGLIFVLSNLVDNKKITKIKMKDNYFSHEIDYVVIDFIVKNTNLKYLDLSKNRLSFQCIQKLQQIIERNIKLETDKEPNKLLVDIYRLKYENTKLAEMKECLKFLENDVEKIKLSRAEMRQDYESFKYKTDEDYENLKKKNDRMEYLLQQRKKEHDNKVMTVQITKKDYEEEIDKLNKTIIELKEKKQQLEEENSNMIKSNQNMENDYIKLIHDLKEKLDENRRKEIEYNAISKDLMEEIIRIDKLIKEKSEK
jgi:Ran GTPase-activating protein (RanGAP) involved in mRNA processing and transport